MPSWSIDEINESRRDKGQSLLALIVELDDWPKYGLQLDPTGGILLQDWFMYEARYVRCPHCRSVHVHMSDDTDKQRVYPGPADKEETAAPCDLSRTYRIVSSSLLDRAIGGAK